METAICTHAAVSMLIQCTYVQGWDKTYCLQFVEKDFDEIHFFGDKTFEARPSLGGLRFRGMRSLYSLQIKA